MIQHVPILLYHSVDDSCAEAYRPWMISTDMFEQQMRLISERGFTPMTVSALAASFAAGGSLPARPVIITFDDGLRDFLTGALPVLKRYEFCATLYVVAGLVGRTSRWLYPLGEGSRPMLTWDELRHATALGIECGAHTLTHRQLDVLGSKAAFTEIVESKRILERRLGVPVQTFAYPHGYASKTTRALVRKAGFTCACRVRHALSARCEDPFALSRVMITNDTTLEDFEGFLKGTGLPVAPSEDRLLANGWRAARILGRLLRRIRRRTPSGTLAAH